MTSDTKPQTPASSPKPPEEWSKTMGSITSRLVGSLIKWNCKLNSRHITHKLNRPSFLQNEAVYPFGINKSLPFCAFPNAKTGQVATGKPLGY
jgi:hypothetical protein